MHDFDIVSSYQRIIEISYIHDFDIVSL